MNRMSLRINRLKFKTAGNRHLVAHEPDEFEHQQIEDRLKFKISANRHLVAHEPDEFENQQIEV